MTQTFKQLSDFKKTALFFTFILFIGFILYLPSLSGPFVFDDISTIAENDMLKQFPNIHLFYIYTPSRFLPYLSFAIQYFFIKESSFGYHLVNVIIHIINTFLVFFFTRSLVSILDRKFINRQPTVQFIPILASFLFLIHPVQTQAVSYISQRFAVMAAFFYLASMFCFVLSSRGRYGLYFFSLVFALGAFFSKENSFTLPISILVLDYIFISQSIRNLLKKWYYLIPYFMMAFIIYSLRSPIVSTSGVQVTIPSMTQGLPISRYQYFLTQINVITRYIQLLIIPINQNLDYDFPLSKSFWEYSIIFSFLFLLTIIIITFKRIKKNQLFAFGILFFFITLSIESSIVPIADVIFEHRIYLPSVGFLLAISSLIIYLPKGFLGKHMFFTRYLPFIVIFLIFSFLTYKRNILWGNDILLWKDTVAKSPNKDRPHFNLGCSYENHSDYKNAIEEFKKTIAINPKHEEGYMHLGISFRQLGQMDKAKEYDLMGIYQLPNNPILQENVAILYLKEGNLAQALAGFQKVLSLNPQMKKSYEGIGIIYLQKGEFEKAVTSFQKAIEIDRSYIQVHFNLAFTYEKMGKLDFAKAEYEKILKMDPGNVEARKRLYRLR